MLENREGRGGGPRRGAAQDDERIRHEKRAYHFMLLAPGPRASSRGCVDRATCKARKRVKFLTHLYSLSGPCIICVDAHGGCGFKRLPPG